jgi:hypothetical protein
MNKSTFTAALLAFSQLCFAGSSDTLVALTSYASDDPSRVRGKATAHTPYDGGFADGCLAGAGGPQTKRLPSDKEYLRGWKAGKRECKANYDRLRRGEY